MAPPPPPTIPEQKPSKNEPEIFYILVFRENQILADYYPERGAFLSFTQGILNEVKDLRKSVNLYKK